MFSRGDKDGKRNQILLSAAKLFAETGYYKTTIEDIARQAGIGKSTVYEYFASKEELFESIVISGCEAYISFFKKHQATLTSTDNKIQSIFYCWLFFISRHSELQKVLSTCMYDRSLQDTIQYLANNFTNLLVVPVKNILAEGLEKGQIRDLDLDFATEMIVSMMFSLTHILILRQDNRIASVSANSAGCCLEKFGKTIELEEVPEIRLLANQATDIMLKGLIPR